MKYCTILLMLILLMAIVCVVNADWLSGGFGYRKEITLSNSGSDLTNYQLKFNVYRSTGTDSGFNVYVGTKCQEDYDDIRFTNTSGTVLSYWIESSNSSSARIWVKFPSIPAGSSTWYLYYGNASATAVSNGDATFIFFDDFSGSSLDSSKWIVSNCGGSSTFSLQDNYLRGKADGVNRPSIRSTSQFSAPFAFDFSARRSENVESIVHWDGSIQGTWDLPVNGYQIAFVNWATPNYFVINRFVQSNVYETARVNVSLDTNWHDYSVKTSLNGISVSLDGSQILSTTDSTHTTGYIGFSTRETPNATNAYYDTVRVRKWIDPEPTISSWGSEETPPAEYTVDFWAVPTSGNVPLSVNFFSNATATYDGEPVIIDYYKWEFGDGGVAYTANASHTYTTNGLYNVSLTVSNTTYGGSNTTTKIGYINVTLPEGYPLADFEVTEKCGNIGDTFYFIDFSTGAGLYAWNWSFGDDMYSELRNPTHQYSSEGTYSVSLTVWGAYGNNTKTRTNLITIPCGVPTPTPTPTETTPTPTPTETPPPTTSPTPTPPITPGGYTEGNITYILADENNYVPVQVWLLLVIACIGLFVHSIVFIKNSDLTAIMSAVFAFITAWASNMIGYIDTKVTYVGEEVLVTPTIQAVHPPWLVYTMLLFALVSVVNIFAAIYKVYLKPTPWNEIYNRKLPKWRNR